MKRCLLSATLGVAFIFAIPEIANAQSAVAVAVDAFRGTDAGRRFVQDVLNLSEASSAEEIIARIGEVAPENRAQILSSITGAGFVKVPNDSSASTLRAQNATLAEQIYDPSSGALKISELVSKYSTRAQAERTVGVKSELLIRNDCPLSFINFRIYHYRLMYEVRYKYDLANVRSPLHKDHTACVENAIASGAGTAGPSFRNSFTGGIEVMVTDTQEFENLFDYVLKVLPAGGEPVIAPNGGGEDGRGNGGPPIGPPAPAVEQARLHHAECERSTKICISSKDHKISADFEVKCQNMCVFRRCRPGIPIDVGHLFRSKSAGRSD